MKKFRSFLNDENAVKKVLILLAPFLLALLVFAGIKLGSYIKNDEPAPEPVPEPVQEEITDEITEPATKAEKPEIFGDFVPFECNGDYTCFVRTVGRATAQNGNLFTSWSPTEDNYLQNTLYYEQNGEDKILFSINSTAVDIYPVAYIDDSLYFNITGSGDLDIDGFYRMCFKYNEAGDIVDSGVSFLLQGFLEPVRAGDDTLILTSVNGGSDYILFDTKTGDYQPIDYNKEVEYSELSDKLAIDMDTAVDIAAKELENIKYFLGLTDHVGTMIPYGENTLIYRPNYIYSGYDEFKYDLYPDYAWRITFKGEFWGVVYINAITGEVTSVSVDFLD